MANRGLLQAAGSWSKAACCAVHGNDCCSGCGDPGCIDHTSSSSWLFGLWPGPPQRFEPTGTDTDYQYVQADGWPSWGDCEDCEDAGDLNIGDTSGPGGSDGRCEQGATYRGTEGEICGGSYNWGATDVEVWYQR